MSIMTDNGSAYRSEKFARLLQHPKIKHPPLHAPHQP